jgi:vitamin B12 transporter
MSTLNLLLLKFKSVRIPVLMLIFIQYYSTAYSQTQISGKIKDTRGHAIPGASISVKNSFDGATSDSSGVYSFSSTDTGLQTLKVSSVGYRAIEVTLQLTGRSVQMDLQLEDEPYEL